VSGRWESFHKLWDGAVQDVRLHGVEPCTTPVDKLAASPQAARIAVEMLKKENFANCGWDVFRSLERR
jgi:hypothetical protein